MRIHRPALVLLALAAGSLASPAGLAAQAETPEQVTGQIVAAMRSLDWMGMARLMHPEALQELRQIFDVILVSSEEDVVEARQELFGVRTAAEAAALPDTVMFANLMKVVLSQEAAEEALGSAQVKVLGHVQEGADTVHVVYRMTMTVQGIEIAMMDVASLGRYGSTWRALLKGDLRAMGAGLRQAIEAQRGLEPQN